MWKLSSSSFSPLPSEVSENLGLGIFTSSPSSSSWSWLRGLDRGEGLVGWVVWARTWADFSSALYPAMFRKFKYLLLLRFLSASLGVSRCMRPLLRLSCAGVSFAARRCRALIACGVVGAPLLAETGCGVLRAPDMCDWVCLGRVAALRSEAGREAESRLKGVKGFSMIPASCRSFDN